MHPDHPLEKRVAIARTHIVDGRPIADTSIPSFVARSWERSRDYGLRVSDHVLFAPLSRADAQVVVEKNAGLIRCALPEMERLYDAFGGADWSVVCVNAAGVVVQAVGGHHGTARELARALQLGNDLSERSVGTNGPGCALVEQRPVVIRGRQHFLDEADRFVCAAVPLFGPEGKLMGALDISYPYAPGQIDALDLLTTASRAVENQMFTSLDDSVIVRFHYRPDMLGTPYAALLAVASNGCIGRRPDRYRPVA